MRVAIMLAGAGMFAIAGCSQQIPEAPAALSGTWAFSYSMATSDGATCTGNIQFTISQTDQTFVGFQRGATALACDNVVPKLGSFDSQGNTIFADEMISGGVASESEVAFALNTLHGSSSGTVTADKMKGNATWTIPVYPSGTAAMSGSWTAVKQ